MNDLFGFTDCICQNCEKHFERLSINWTYKISLGSGKYKYYCSYSCWIHALESKQEESTKARSTRLSSEHRSELNRLLDEGVPSDQIARRLKVTKQLVHYYLKKKP